MTDRELRYCSIRMSGTTRKKLKALAAIHGLQMGRMIHRMVKAAEKRGPVSK